MVEASLSLLTIKFFVQGASSKYMSFCIGYCELASLSRKEGEVGDY